MSRNISDLQNPFRSKALLFKEVCHEGGLQVLIYCTSRTVEEQARLYRQGRNLSEIKLKATELAKKYNRVDLAKTLIKVGPQKGKKVVTWAGPGQSLHNYAYAFDGVPMQNGKPVWGTRQTDDLELWLQYGTIAKSLGLVWAGDWPERKREFPHVQHPDVSWRDLITIKSENN